MKIVEISTDYLITTLEDEVVLLNLSTDKYHRLNHVGATIWRTLEKQASTVDEIVAAVQNEFDVSASQCEQDVHQFIDKLLTANLVKLHTQ